MFIHNHLLFMLSYATGG